MESIRREDNKFFQMLNKRSHGSSRIQICLFSVHVLAGIYLCKNIIDIN